MSGYVEPSEQEVARIVRDTRVAAVVGMKDERSDVPAFEIPQRMKRAGIRLIPVNPTIERSLGEPAFSDVAAVPDAFDAVVVFRRADAVPALAEEILALPRGRWPRVVWLQSGIVSDVAAERLSAAGITVVMDRCFGVELSKARR